MWRGWWILFWLTACTARTAGAGAVWIDTDPSIGPPWREVDDAFALVLAFHSPEVRIVGISTTYGNAPLKRTTAVARELVFRFGRSAGVSGREVYAGASAAGQGSRNAATDALAQALRQTRLTYVALGPLTNLAAFLELHPELAGRIERVILVGGRSPGQALAFGPTGALRVHDANVFKDPAAVAAILRTRIPLVLAPVEISRQMAFDRADLRALRRQSPTGEYLFRRTRVWLWFWTKIVREEGGPLFDLLAVLPVVQPGALVTEERFATFDARGDLIARPGPGQGARRIRFATRVRAGAKQLVLDRLLQRAVAGVPVPKYRFSSSSKKPCSRNERIARVISLR